VDPLPREFLAASQRLRRRIDPEGTLDIASKSAISRLRELLAEVKPLRVNFAALAIETSTAIRRSWPWRRSCTISTPMRRSAC
jgi:hypothetical protein